MRTGCRLCDPNVGAARTGTSASIGAAAGVMEIANPENPVARIVRAPAIAPSPRDRPFRGAAAALIAYLTTHACLILDFLTSPGCPLFWRHARAIPQYSSGCPSLQVLPAARAVAARVQATPRARMPRRARARTSTPRMQEGRTSERARSAPRTPRTAPMPDRRRACARVARARVCIRHRTLWAPMHAATP